MSLFPLAAFDSPLVGADPFRSMRKIMHQMDKEMERYFPESQSHTAPRRRLAAAGRGAGDALQSAPELPSLSFELDVQETPEAYLLHADLPGLAKDQVKLHLSPDRVLTVSGERAREDVKEGTTWRRVERSFGHFERSIQLPEAVDPSRVTAKMEKGVLEVIVPKAPEEERKGHQITIA